MTDISNPYRRIAVDLQRHVDEMHYSRAWQLTLAFGLARRSFRDLVRLPGRVWRIMTNSTEPPRPGPYATESRAATDADLHRAEEPEEWPATRPLVSIVLLSSGNEQAMGETLESLSKSSLHDFEVVVVHPPGKRANEPRGDTGDAANEIRFIEMKDPGSAEGRNAAVESAVGKYVLLLRGGDHLDPTYLEKTAFALEDRPGLAFVYGQTTVDGEQPFPSEPFGLRRELRYNHVPDSALFRRAVWAQAGGFRPETTFDIWDFWVAAGTLGWSGLLLREDLVRLGPESLREQIASRDAARDTGETDKIARRHAALLDGQPPSAQVRAPIATDETASASDHILAFSERKFANFSAHKPAILCVVPWLNIGGAEVVVLQLLRGLKDRFSFVVAATLDVEHNRAVEFRALTPWVYHLPEWCAADPGRYLAQLAAVHGVQGVLVSSSEAGYRALPAFKQRGLWAADIVHNTTPEGHLDKAIRFDHELDVHFACGRQQTEALQNATGGGPSKIRTVWTAVDAQETFHPGRYEARRSSLRAEFDLEDRNIVIAYVGRLSIEKDVPLFIASVAEILQRHPGAPIRALVAGDGPELLRVEQAIEQAGVWNEVTLLGDSRRVPEILAMSDYMFLTSKTEGSPITILEAMSLKLVVLTTAVGNVRDVIDDGVNGIVVEMRNPGAFADRFDEIRRDADREASMREAARRTIIDRFDEPQMFKGYSEVFSAALGPNAPNRSV